jgi:hypothetical protein
MTRFSRLWLSAAATMAASAVAHADGGANHVRDVRVHDGDAGAATDVEIVGTQPPVYQARFDATR